MTMHHRLHRAPEGASAGLGADPPLLVLVHGWCCDSGYWDAQVPALAATHPVLTLDLPGHGASEGVTADGSMAQFGAAVAALVEQVLGGQALAAGAAAAAGPGAAGPVRAPSSVVLIGHSMGGPVAVEAARRLGDRVRGVLGVDTFWTVGLPSPPVAEFEARVAPFHADFAASVRGFVLQSFFLPDADPALRERIAADMAAGDPAAGLAAMRGFSFWDGAAAFADLAERGLPVTAINAAMTPIDEGGIRSIAPLFKLRRVEGVGHFLMMERPEAFNAILREELRRFG